MTPMKAIQSATAEAANLIGHPDVIGSIAPGRFGDIIAVRQDPFKDVTVLEKIEFVMKSGMIYRNEHGKRE